MSNVTSKMVDLQKMASYIASDLSYPEYQRIKPLLEECFQNRAKLEKVNEVMNWLPITTPELIRLRNVGEMTFAKQVNVVTTCLIQLRECLAGETNLKQES